MSGADRLKHATFAIAGFIPVVGWAGRAAKGGKAVHSTAKGMKAIDNSLSAYQHGKSLDVLRKTEYGIYGLTSANGFGEYITGKDMFGNELSEKKRNQSLTESLFILGVSGMGMYADRLIDKNAVYAKPPSGNTPNNGIMNTIDQSISQGIKNLNSMIHDPKLAHEFAGSGTNVTVSSFKDTLQRVNKVTSKGSGGVPPLHLNIAGNNYNQRIQPKVEGFDPKKASTKQKGNFGEIVSSDNILNNQSLKEAGYDLKPIGRNAPSGIDDKIVRGIDGLYENTNPNSPIKYVIDEAKFGSGRLGKTKDGKQMSNDWLTGESTGRSRIYKVVDKDEFLTFEITDALERNAVERVLSKVDANGNVKTFKLDRYGNKVGEWP